MSCRVVLGMALLLATATAFAEDKIEPKDKTAKVKKLQVQRRDLLKKALDARNEEFMAGRASLDAVADVSKALVKAELDVAATAAQRLAAHKARFDVAKKLEEVMVARHEAGRCSETEKLLAQSDRLEAEIAWLKAGGEEKKAKKDKDR